jgi:hypothetical protein
MRGTHGPYSHVAPRLHTCSGLRQNDLTSRDCVTHHVTTRWCGVLGITLVITGAHTVSSTGACCLLPVTDCTGTLVPQEPNIPAELLYDKADDGLALSNPWAGYHVILNPDFRQGVQVRCAWHTRLTDAELMCSHDWRLPPVCPVRPSRVCQWPQTCAQTHTHTQRTHTTHTHAWRHLQRSGALSIVQLTRWSQGQCLQFCWCAGTQLTVHFSSVYDPTHVCYCAAVPRCSKTMRNLQLVLVRWTWFSIPNIAAPASFLACPTPLICMPWYIILSLSSVAGLLPCLGVVVFMLARADHKDAAALYARFFDGFAAAGEPNIPIDRGANINVSPCLQAAQPVTVCIKAYCADIKHLS